MTTHAKPNKVLIIGSGLIIIGSICHSSPVSPYGVDSGWNPVGGVEVTSGFPIGSGMTTRRGKSARNAGRF